MFGIGASYGMVVGWDGVFMCFYFVFLIFSCSESELSLADTLSFVGVISGLFDRGPGTGSQGA